MIEQRKIVIYNNINMAKESVLTPSLENYLEAILYLEKKNKVARVKDIANMLDVQMPSVTGALKTLKSKGLIRYEKNSYINLTERGTSIARSVQNRHSIIANFLERTLGLSPDDAERQACQMEHIISMDTARRIENLSMYIEEKVLDDSSLTEESWHELLTQKP